MSLYKLARNWWWVALRGLFAVVFVLASFFGTSFTLLLLVRLFGVYALVDGLVVTFAGLTNSHGVWPRWVPLMEGLLGIGAGAASFLSPGLTAVGLVYLIVGWAVARGALEFTASIRLLRAVDKRHLLALGVALILALGALLLKWPTPVGFALLWLTGAYTLVFGLLQIGLGFRIRNWQNRWMRPLRLQPVEVRAGRPGGHSPRLAARGLMRIAR